MEVKNRSLIPLFFMMLIFGISEGFLFCYSMVLPFLLADASSSAADLATIHFILGLIRALIPLMVIILLYPMGRKIDLKTKLVPLIINLIGGLYIGEIIGFNVVLIFTGNFSGPILFQSISLFFVAFTALAISYLRHNKQNSIKQ